MSSSELGYVRLFPIRLLKKDMPLSAPLVREGSINNLLHLFDQNTQQKVAWEAQSASDRITLTTGSSYAYSTYSTAAFDVSLDRDGQPISLVVQLAIGTTDGTGSDVKVYIAPAIDSYTLETGTAVEIAGDSGTDQWETAAVADLSPWFETRHLRTITTEIFDGSGRANALVLPVRCHFWMKSDAAESTVRLVGVNIREYIDP